MLFWNAGIMGRKEQLLEAIFGSMRSSKEVISTSRRHHVATPPRRDVSSKICISSLNARGLENEGIGRRTTGDTELENRATQPSRNFLEFCITYQLFWIFLNHMMMFFILYILFLAFMMF